MTTFTRTEEAEFSHTTDGVTASGALQKAVDHVRGQAQGGGYTYLVTPTFRVVVEQVVADTEKYRATASATYARVILDSPYAVEPEAEKSAEGAPETWPEPF
jgi:hypothetical protein